MSEIPAILERVLSMSKADACIVIGARRSTANVRWANNTSTTNGLAESEDLVIISIIDERVGTIARNHFPDEQLEDLVRESEAACDGKPAAEDAMPLLEGDGTPPADWSAPPAATTLGVFRGFSEGLADLFGRASSTGMKLFGYAEHETTTYWLATSSGLRKRYTQPAGKVEITGKSNDYLRSSWTGQVTTTFTDLDLEGMYAKLEQRLDWSKTMLKLEPGRYEVLLEPAAVADMGLYQMYESAARDADEGRTVFSKPGGGNRIGEKLMAGSVSLYSDPHEPGLEVLPFSLAMGSSSFQSVFDNGLETGRSEWVRDGVLRALITTRYWAQRTGAPGPVPFVPNMIMPGDGPSLDDMIARTKRALLVTSFWYIREVDPQTLLLTGLTRDGVFLIEDGEVKGAVNNFRYNMSPVQMFANVTEVGSSVPTATREFEIALCKFPAVRVRDFFMSSVSEAT